MLVLFLLVLLELQWLLAEAEVVDVPLFGEVVAVVDEADSGV